MSRHGNWAPECKVYIGDLKAGTTERDIEEPFSKFGQLKNVWVAQRPPGFAFVEFDDPRDAEDSCRHLDGVRINGSRVRVEMSHGRKRGGGGRGRSRSPPRGGGGYDRRRSPSPRRGYSPRRDGGRGRSPSPRRDGGGRYDRFRSRSPRRSPSPP